MSREHRPEDYLEALCGALSEGMPRATACRLAGLRPSVLDRWLSEGDAGNPRFQGAAEEILAAEAVGHATLWRDIRSARDWKAKLALLKAADPSTYNEKSTVDVKVTPTVLQSLPADVLEAELIGRADDIHGILPSSESVQHTSDAENASEGVVHPPTTLVGGLKSS